MLQLSHKLDDSKDKKGNHCEQSACGHMTAKYNSFLQLKHLPMNEKSEKYSEKQATLLIWEWGTVLSYNKSVVW